MKIDIGPDGKILGTKRVSANGQVSGFTEYAGAEVLVILPGGTRPVVRRDARDVLAEMEQVVEERMKIAFDQYHALRRRFESPKKAAETFLKSVSPQNLRGVVERADRWLTEQAQALEARVEKKLNLGAAPKSTRKRKE